MHYIPPKEDYDMVMYSVSLPDKDGQKVVNQPLMAVALSDGEHGYCRARAIFAAAMACESTGDFARDVTLHETQFVFSQKDAGGRSYSPLRSGTIRLGEVARNAASNVPDEKARKELMEAIESDDMSESNDALISLYRIVLQVEMTYLGDTERREQAIKEAMEARS